MTGRGYEGHYFWDTEIYVVPFLMHTSPDWARQVLDFRCGMLEAARGRAREIGHGGAAFPWRTINGEEASAWYAAGTAQYHINADIAYALRHYTWVTGDLDFVLERGAEVMVETARLWMELGFFSERRGGRFCINGVTGPDEYTTVVDNNAYTNLMARENLEGAVRVTEWLLGQDPDAHARLVRATGLRDEEVEGWRRAAELMYLPRHEELGIVLQDEHFLDREPWDFAGTPPEAHPLLLHYHPLELYRHQVIKQADVVLATYLVDRAFSPEETRRTFDYYDALTTGDSTLSACVQSIMASAVGYPEAALGYFLDACAVDLADAHGNTADGIHIAVLRRHVARARRRLRRPARLRRRGAARPAAAGGVGRAAVPHQRARPAARGRHDARGRRLPADRGLRAADQPPRRGAAHRARRAGLAPDCPARSCSAPRRLARVLAYVFWHVPARDVAPADYEARLAAFHDAAARAAPSAGPTATVGARRDPVAGRRGRL